MSRYNMLNWAALALSGFVAYAILQPGKELSESEQLELRKVSDEMYKLWL